MELDLLSLLCTFENSLNVQKYRSIRVLFRIAERSISKAQVSVMLNILSEKRHIV